MGLELAVLLGMNSKVESTTLPYSFFIDIIICLNRGFLFGYGGHQTISGSISLSAG